jgi:hypothetical protein
MTRLSALLRRIGRFRRRESGAATIEFVIWFPFFFVLVCSSIETGLLMTRHVMLERGLDMTVRGLRLGFWPAPSHDDIKRAICDGAVIIPNCSDALSVELLPVSTTTWALPTGAVTCTDRSADVQPVTQLIPGISNELMLIRVCSKFSPFFPTTGFGMSMTKDGAGNYALVSISAFVNEP